MELPYTRKLIDAFADKLIEQIQAKRVKQAIWLSNNSTDTRWFHKLAQQSDALYFPRGRIKFGSPNIDTKQVIYSQSPLQGQVLIYFGFAAELFLAVFNAKVPGIGMRGDSS